MSGPNKNVHDGMSKGAEKYPNETHAIKYIFPPPLKKSMHSLYFILESI